jgi:valyl-tRNA synthetase
VNKEIPIIADEFVEKEFGTGCVNVTPFGTQLLKHLKLKRFVELITNYFNEYRRELVAC